MIEFITDQEIYSRVLLQEVPASKDFLWLATSDLKDLHIKKNRRYLPFLEVLSYLLSRNVSVRLIHAKEPGPVFREEFDRYPILAKGLERLLCPRVHFKSIIVDGKVAYTGSANLTGAGMGARSEGKRNFEAGIISSDPKLVGQIMQQFDDVWMGKFCGNCHFSDKCPDRDAMT
ncbi:MAG: phospholipase [Fibrobacter sp.]|nr:phospholipase [Fibrobacter sp.]